MLWLLLTTSNGASFQYLIFFNVRRPKNQRTGNVSLIASNKTKWVSIPFKNSNSNFVTAIVVDDIVIKLVKGEIDRAEEAHQSWIITGFPRTKVQALSLQRLKVIPDKFIHLNIRAETSI